MRNVGIIAVIAAVVIGGLMYWSFNVKREVAQAAQREALREKAELDAAKR